MGLKREFLKSLGIEDDKIESIMAEYGKTVQNMMTKGEVDAMLKEQKAEWEKTIPAEKKLTDFEEYHKLLKENREIKLNGKLAEKKVKAKFFNDVIAKLGKDEDFEKDIEKLNKDFPEFFESVENADEQKDKGNPPVGMPKFTQADNNPNIKLSAEEMVKERFKKGFLG